MIVAGIMSGTSADGINVALVRIQTSGSARSKRQGGLQFKLLGHAEYPYPKPVRAYILATMNSTKASVPDLARLNFLLAELYADALLATQKRFHIKAELVGCHGQTLYHQGEPASFLGRKLAMTWQSGDGSVLAVRVGIPVVSDFRPADLASGGKGAPLVPFLDFLLYRDRRFGRIIQNIGGIANLTAIPAWASSSQVIAFDTGPGNMVIDAVTQRLFDQPYDRDGILASSGNLVAKVVAETLRLPFFRRKPPKTAGREEFGREFASEFIRRCGRASKHDVVATATALTAKSIADAVNHFVMKKASAYRELIVSGGGSNNSTLMAMLANDLATLGLQLRFSDEFGLPSEAKEAVAFAVLAYQTWNRKPSNIPSATGARRPAILGKISYV
jgi:anhydro-N-acetylmuramic acid kinase